MTIVHDFHSRARITFFLLGLIVALVALNLFLIPGYTGDDSFIHFTYSRNLIEHGVISYNTPVPTYGSTSILWVLLCALGSVITGSVPLAGQILSGIFFAASVLLFARYLLNVVRLSDREVIAGCVLFIANAIAFRWMLTGMETSLSLCIVTVLLNTWKADRPIRNAVWTLVAYLIRPEFLLLPIAYAVTAYGRRRTEGLRAVATYGATIVVLFGAWYLVAFLYFGSLLPLTVQKSGSGMDLDSLAKLLKVVAGMYPDMLLSLAALSVGGILTAGLLRRLPLIEQLLLLFGAGVAAVYLLNGTNVVSRYLLILHPMLVLLLIRGWGAMGHWREVLVAAVLVVQAALFGVIHYRPVWSFIDGFQKTYTAIGKQLDPAGAQDPGAVMLADVGIVGYYSRRPVIDLFGLTSRHIYEAGTRADTAILARYGPRFVVARLETPGTDSCSAAWRAARHDLLSVTERYHEKIGQLGVLAGSHESYDVYLLELTYGAR